MVKFYETRIGFVSGKMRIVLCEEVEDEPQKELPHVVVHDIDRGRYRRCWEPNCTSNDLYCKCDTIECYRPIFINMKKVDSVAELGYVEIRKRGVKND